MTEINRPAGRRAFGRDPAAYARFRPGYPVRVYEILHDRCGLRPGTRTFEVGPGTGQATRQLLRSGAAPLIVVEPDERLAAFLEGEIGPSPEGKALEVRRLTFEDVALEPASFDLGVAATSFHWLEQAPALAKVARALRPGGWWAVWWNVFADPDRSDPFHEAIQGIFASLAPNPAGGSAGTVPFALDADARLGDLDAAGAFEDAARETIRGTLTLDAAGIRGLFSTFSDVTRLEPDRRQRLLDALAAVVADRFGGKVEKPVLTAIYTARKKG
jgi:SAM-dependent methyltransferase